MKKLVFLVLLFSFNNCKDEPPEIHKGPYMFKTVCGVVPYKIKNKMDGNLHKWKEFKNPTGKYALSFLWDVLKQIANDPSWAFLQTFPLDKKDSDLHLDSQDNGQFYLENRARDYLKCSFLLGKLDYDKVLEAYFYKIKHPEVSVFEVYYINN
ncbi:MAG: hypothetical protein PF693_09300 [Spirochaetia bacterium]|jgi:hypothetical protein|nr:hypothetical protein [Spirochaetia bacterium]